MLVLIQYLYHVPNSMLIVWLYKSMLIVWFIQEYVDCVAHTRVCDCVAYTIVCWLCVLYLAYFLGGRGRAEAGRRGKTVVIL